MPVITQPIDQRSFEVIRDRIVEILGEEIPNQVLLNPTDQLIQNARVWCERFVPFDVEEMPAVNVMVATVDPGVINSAPSYDNSHDYIIDVYTKSPSTSVTAGDTLAMLKLHRLAGLVAAIIMDPVYYTLGFQAPFIERRVVTGIKFVGPEKAEAGSMVMARVNLTVMAPDMAKTDVPPLAVGFNTIGKIGLTEQGYVFGVAGTDS